MSKSWFCVSRIQSGRELTRVQGGCQHPKTPPKRAIIASAWKLIRTEEASCLAQSERKCHELHFRSYFLHAPESTGAILLPITVFCSCWLLQKLRIFRRAFDATVRLAPSSGRSGLDRAWKLS